MDGKLTTVMRGAPNFNQLRAALIAEKWDDVKAHLRADTSLQRWAKGRFTIKGQEVSFDGTPIPSDLNNRIVDMAATGEDPEPLFKFWENLQQNPSMRSVQQLWRFLNQLGIPLTKDGHFLAYKGVRTDFMDQYTGKFENKPGAVIKMPRNHISDDPDHACHQGLHVGALEYATAFGPKVVIVKVNPRDVVSVPNDHSSRKMRVCEYAVIGIHSGEYMPSTSIPEEELPEKEPEYDGTVAKAPVKARPQKWATLDAMDDEQLMSVTLEKLRVYASKGLKMVGASRVGGGKLGLIKAINKARA